jgi:putative FmdB family regulatory protein
MPIYEYQATEQEKSCPHCVNGFEQIQTMSDSRLEVCPECGMPVRKQISAPSVGRSKSGFDDRAKKAGFHKLEKLGKGEYEKKY